MTKKLTMIFLSLLVFVFASWANIPKETIIAEFGDGNITIGELNDRIEKIPPMYRSRYNSEEGKRQLLDMMCIEELFFLEAMNLDVEEDSRYLGRINNEIRSVYMKYYKEDLSKDIELTSDEKKAYFNEHPEQFKDKTYEDSEALIERRMKPQKEKEIYENRKQNLISKFDVQLIDENLEKFDLEDMEENLKQSELPIITSNLEEMNKDMADLVELYEILPDRNRQAIKTISDLKTYLQNLIELDVFYYDAKEQNYQDHQQVKADIKQIEKNLKLRTAYNKLVVDAIDLDDESLRKYYDDNIDQFSSRPYRKIQAFVFQTEKTAKKNLQEAKKLINKNDYPELIKLVQENSTLTKDNGILDHIYQNDIIPGIGKDKAYSNKIWEAPADSTQLSSVFKNSKDEYLFFRILEDHPQEPQPFENIKNQIKSTLLKEEQKEKYQEVSEELKNKYDLKTYPERMIQKLTVKEYFDKAEAAQKKKRFLDAIHYYEQVIKFYPNGVDDYKAVFMKGFLYAEELNNNDEALSAFRKVINEFEEGELHESAQFMIDELEGKSSYPTNLEN